MVILLLMGTVMEMARETVMAMAVEPGTDGVPEAVTRRMIM